MRQQTGQYQIRMGWWLLWALAWPTGGMAQQSLVQVRRQYADCRFGQLHYRVAEPVDKQKIVHPPLFCFHQSPSSGHIFGELMKKLATDRIVYAPDTPGFGQSDAPSTQPEIGDYAAAMLDWMNGLGHSTYDLLGYHTGALIATEIAIERPKAVRKVVLVGLAVFTETEQQAFSAQPWPRPTKEDGSHLLQEWQRTLQWRGAGQTMPMMAQNFVYKLMAGEKAWWGARAAIYYPATARFLKMQPAVLAIRPQDDLWEISLRAKPLLTHAQWIDLPQYGFGLFEVAPGEVNKIIREFMDR